jgi:hypothetical protein
MSHPRGWSARELNHGQRRPAGIGTPRGAEARELHAAGRRGSSTAGGGGLPAQELDRGRRRPAGSGSSTHGQAGRRGADRRRHVGGRERVSDRVGGEGHRWKSGLLVPFSHPLGTNGLMD